MTTALQERMQQAFVTHVDDDRLMDCMRCGFCLPACPTYIHSNFDETQSPRGRIALMRAVRDGQIMWDGSVEESFDLCLGCRACEPACPAGVQYGTLIEETREAILSAKSQTMKEKVIRKGAFDHLFADQKKMHTAVNLVTFYQKSGLQKVVRKIGFLDLFPPFMKEMESVIPDPPKRKRPQGQQGEVKVKVAFFAGCLMDTMFNETNRNTIAILEKLGCEVVIPKNQQCCGALHGHSGELEKSKRNAKRNMEAFQLDDIDYIVNNAGGCGAFLEEYDKLFADDPRLYEKAKQFTAKQIDISSLFVKLGIVDFLEKLPKKSTSKLVTYQDSCHLRNVTGVKDEPRQILKAVQDCTFIELPNADLCCGSAGIYNLLQPKMSSVILKSKMQKVQEVSAGTVITTNPGCLLQMKVGIEREGLTSTTQAMHLVDFIYERIFAQ
ncbi:(Fe-S)-binding protein [Psychrobacillus lasiicapitis]|uniref:Glycolate oxidase iron-sulfur subunit n=1 Tax=Psychrobacillus lasiicapitis TaxID=1636719 RepID=A0A544T2L8_9BACI|nr:(Fe-S)-binding protein [Psychrobacillus lasiicapitis]TQR11712.1 (Fe-S)-binding protein [Psychrobacillus lasiicapitis]GGA18885.1 putative glycolate oxidase iron-sulfur subunit [Psychrobacillus lasiicapitis]